MSSSIGQPDGPAGPIQLNGWKEIAAYLGRSVRTVQRWEKDFGLPVRRFGLSKPESVFAVPREIDAWLETAQGISARSGTALPGAATSRPGASEAAPAGGTRKARPFFDRRELVRVGITVVTTVVATVGIWIGWQAWQRPSQPAPALSAAPADWHVDLDSLVVTDATGNVLWRRAFAHELNTASYNSPKSVPRMLRGGVTDLEGDGAREVWFITSYAGAQQSETALYVFEHDGTLRWTYRPEYKVRFGDDAFGPSWIVDRGFITPDPAGGRGRAIWASFIDMALFPSAIERLDTQTGAPLGAYWTNGSIVTAALDTSTPAQPKLLVGACFNETRAGSLSVVDALNPNGSAPAALDKYRCMDCPPGEPLAFLVFPKPARFAGSDATGPVETITLQSDGSIGVRVRHAVAGPGAQAVGMFHLDASLAPVSVDTADGYLSVYNTLAARGEAPAAPPIIDPEREFLPVLWWNAAAQRFMEVTKRQ
jgi:hypothetical protein